MIKKIVVIPILFFCFFGYSQKDSLSVAFEPKNLDSLVKVLDLVYEGQLASIENKNRKQVKRIYKQRHEDLVEMLNDSIFIFDHKLESYQNSILQKIYDANPEIDKEDFKFLFNRSVIPNAACFGDKTFMVNLGLISLLENEDQYAFILCHEIAHYQLNHVNQSIDDRITKLNSKQVLSEAREIKRKKYGRTTEGMSFLKDLTFDFLKHNREVEIQADSLGFQYFRKTKYSEIESQRSLKLLGEIEEVIFKDSIRLSEVLNFETYPFKKYWLNKEKSLFDIKEKVDDYEWDKDSLKTHPDTDLRILSLNKLKPQESNVKKGVFSEIQKYTNYKTINALIDMNQLDFALYYSLSKIQENNKVTPFYYSKVAQIFAKMYDLRKNHKLGKSIPAISTLTKEKNINEIRQFINNLELKNIRKIGYAFCLKHEEIAKEETDFQNAFEELKQLNNKQ